MKEYFCELKRDDMGFKHLESFSMTLLAKQGWHLLATP
uniref:Uncharacterized protein n=1 Tax=Manihot esculenta TaxID=3983 RepID=A0A2C9W722_MANES